MTLRPVESRRRVWLSIACLLSCAWFTESTAGAIPDSLTAAQRTAVEEFLGARASGDPARVAGAIHPAELEELRARVLGLLRQEAARGEGTIRSRLFGQAMPLAQIERFTPADFYAALGRKLSLPGREYSRVRGLAAVPGRNGDVHAVVEATQPQERDSKPEVVELVTLRPYGRDWKAAIPEEIQAQIDDLIHARATAAEGPTGLTGAAGSGLAIPPGIVELLNATEQTLLAGKCEEYYRQRMSENFRRVTSQKALETLIGSCQRGSGTREMLLATVRIVRERQPSFEYEGRRAIYDLRGQGLPFERFVLEEVDRHWFIAE